MSHPARQTLKLVVIVALSMHAHCARADSVYSKIGYPEQPLAESLKQLAAHTQIQLIYLAQLASDRTAPAVPSGLTISDTLRSMLAGSGLTFRFLNERTIAIESMDTGTPKKKYAHMNFETSGAGPVANAQSTRVTRAAAARTLDAGDLGEEMVVTGTRFADRTRLETLAPVDVFSVGQLTRHGSAQLAQAISSVAPSINFPRPAITDGTDHIRPATIRGLAPDQTLVLVNSKRRHQSSLVNVNTTVGRGSATVDLNAIPLAAIDSIEVLRDGASAQYGSDAIGGVINLRLRAAREGGESMISLGGFDSEVVTARGRRKEHDGRTVSISGWSGLPLGPEGFLTVSAEYHDREPTSRGDYDTRVLALPDPEPLRVTSRYGEPEMRDTTFYANGGLPVGSWDVYGWLGYQARNGESAAFPRLADNYNNVSSIYPNGFLPLIATDIDDFVAALGSRGTIGEWDADLSLAYGGNSLDYRTENSINGSLGAASPTSFDSGGLRYDQLTANIDLVRQLDWGWAVPVNLAAGLEARYETFDIRAGEPDSYRAGPSPPPRSSPGAQGFPGFQPDNQVHEGRRAVGIYTDVEAQLTRSLRMSAAARGENYDDVGAAVTGKLSARYDFTGAFALRSAVSTGFRAPGLQQSYFTSTATNFINGVPYEIGTFPATSSIAQALGARRLRAEKSRNYSLGAVFRLADLEATLDAYRIDIDDRIVLSENLNQRNVQELLAPFRVAGARFFMNGVDTTTRGLDLAVRYVLRTDGIGNFELTLVGNRNDTDVTRVPSTSVLAALNPAPSLFARVNRLSFERGTPASKIIAGVDWSIPYSYGTWGVAARATRYGEVVEAGVAMDGEPADLRDITLSPAWLLDLSVTGNVLHENLSVSIGADNLTDRYPERTPIARANPNGPPINLNPTNAVGFSRYSPYGFNGRFIYARASYRW